MSLGSFLGKLPVIKQVASALKGVGAMLKFIGFMTGKRTQHLLIVIGLLASIAQPWVASHYPEYNDILLRVMQVLGIGAGLTFADKVQRILDELKAAAGK